MRTGWILIGLGVAVAAGATMVVPTLRTSNPATAPTGAVEAALPTREIKQMREPTIQTGNLNLPQAGEAGRSTLAPIGQGPNGGSQRTGPLEAPKPTRVSEAALKRQKPPPQPGTAVATPAKPPQPVTTTTTGGAVQAGRLPVAPALDPRGQAQASQELERRRQELERARRQRLASAQQRASNVSPHQVAPGQQDRSNREGGDGSDGISNDNGAPTLDDIIRDNPWLADYAPGGSRAGQTGTTGGGGGTSGNNGSGSGNNGSGSGNNGSGSGNNGSGSGTVGGGGDTGTIIGGGGGGLGTPTITTRWISIDNRSCGSALAGARTNDLYIRISNATPVLSIDLSQENGIDFVGGMLRQVQGGNALPPITSGAGGTGGTGANVCLAFDTYLNGGGEFTLAPTDTSDGTIFPSNSTVSASLFRFSGSPGVQDSAKFGDDGYYIFVGRFSAATTVTDVSGVISVGYGGLGTFREVDVLVPFDPTIWRFDPTFALPASSTGTPPPGPGGGGEPPPPGPGGGGEPPPLGPGGGGNPPPANDPCSGQSEVMTAVWLSVNNGNCEDEANGIDLTGFRTADLFLRMPVDVDLPSQPAFRVTFYIVGELVTPPGGGSPVWVDFLRISGGEFHQDISGSIFRPFASDVADLPCLAFDSYAAMDTGSTEAGPSDQQPSALQADSFTSEGLFGIYAAPAGASTGIPAVQDTARFPNDPCGRYVRIGRFTVTPGASLSGELTVIAILAGRSSATNIAVVVPNCATCWGTTGQ